MLFEGTCLSARRGKFRERRITRFYSRKKVLLDPKLEISWVRVKKATVFYKLYRNMKMYINIQRGGEKRIVRSRVRDKSKSRKWRKPPFFFHEPRKNFRRLFPIVKAHESIRQYISYQIFPPSKKYERVSIEIHSQPKFIFSHWSLHAFSL